MKTNLHILILTALLHLAAFGQGPLTPGGPPASSMKSLTEIHSAITNLKDDKRTPILALPYTITQPGSYYLAGNLTVTGGAGIAIEASNVTVDLNGFTISSTLSGTSGSGFAIFIDLNLSNIQIRNGNIVSNTTVSGSVFTPNGFFGGISSPSPANQSIYISDLCVRGMAGSAININSASFSTVENCFVSVCDGLGIQAHTVKSSFAADCRLTAISATIVTDSRGASVGTTFGSDGIAAGIISNSYGTSIAGTGITSGGTVSYCRAKRDGGVAINATIAVGCTVSGTGTVSSSQKHLGTP